MVVAIRGAKSLVDPPLLPYSILDRSRPSSNSGAPWEISLNGMVTAADRLRVHSASTLRLVCKDDDFAELIPTNIVGPFATNKCNHSDDYGFEDIKIAWRDAATDERPEGRTWRSPTEDDLAILAYDVWEAHRKYLDAVESGDYDVIAFLTGYGSRKSVFGVCWLLAQALEHSGSRFSTTGVDF